VGLDRGTGTGHEQLGGEPLVAGALADLRG
jgi:hypothetical protein